MNINKFGSDKEWLGKKNSSKEWPVFFYLYTDDFFHVEKIDPVSVFGNIVQDGFRLGVFEIYRSYNCISKTCNLNENN